MIRKTFFWIHLTAGSLAGLVILIMSLTGVLLAWQRQIIHWADRSFQHAPAPGQSRIAPETLLTKVVEARHALPATFTIRSAANEPASAELGRNAIVYVNPWTGEVLGEGWPYAASSVKSRTGTAGSLPDWNRGPRARNHGGL